MARKASGRPNGRPPGRKSASTIERERQYQAVKVSSLEGLTEEQIALLLPRDIFRLVAHVAVRAKDIGLMLKAAADWAPYEHPKLTSATLDATVRRTASDFTDDELLALSRAGMGDAGDEETRGSTH